MIRARHALPALLVAAVACTARAAPETYNFDPAQTFVHFEVRHFQTSTLRGRFGPIRGQVMLDAAAGRGRLGLVIDMTTLSTGFKPLDSRLREQDLLDIGRQPNAYFVAERIQFEGDKPVELRGEFTLRGVGVPLSLRATRFDCVETPPQGRRCGGDFEGELRRSEFGATFGLPLVADSVRLHVQVEAQRTAAAP